MGVGPAADVAELTTIATDKRHVYSVESFDALDKIQTVLKLKQGSC